MGNKVVVVCPKPTRPFGSNLERPSICDKNGYRIITLNSYTHPKSSIQGRLKESYSFGQRVAEYIRGHSHEIDVIYANTHPTFGQYLLLREAKKENIPTVLHIQDIYPESLMQKLGLAGKFANPFLVKIDRHEMVKAKKIVTISESMKNHLISSRGYSHDFLSVIYNWQDETIFNDSDTDPQQQEFCFMFVGSLSPTAGLETVIESFVQANISNSKLVFAGDGTSKEKCIKLAQNYPNVKIEFLSVSPPDVPRIQKQANVLLLPLKKGISKTAMPSKFPAYLFSGIPVLACVESDSEIATHIRNSGAGWVVEPENVQDLSEAMRVCHSAERKTMQGMGEKAKRYGIEHFSRMANLKKLCNLILEQA